MKLNLPIFLILLLMMTPARAEEGMWIPALLHKYTIQDMQKAGFKLTADDIYDINKASLKDAIVGLASSFNPTQFWGTGSFISSTGLVLTNHHCGVSYIQKHSTETHNYLRDGFYASSHDDELPAEGLCLSRLVRMEDVTKQLLDGTDTLDVADRNRMINLKAKKIMTEATAGTSFIGKVKSYFGGGQYFLEIYEVYKDVRLVAVPPMDLAKFGGEADNWTWPRQSADFCILRVYGDEQNHSGTYDQAHTPIMPLKTLSLSEKGYAANDFAMVLGFPGSTRQYLTSAALGQLLSITNYHSILIRDAKVNIINQAIREQPDLWLKYIDYLGKTSNSLLRWKAESEGIERFKLVEAKQEEERAFTDWVSANKDRVNKYGDLLPTIEEFIRKLDTLELLNVYITEGGINGANITKFVAGFDRLYTLSRRKKLTGEKLTKELADFRNQAAYFFNEHDLDVEKRMLKAFVGLMNQHLPEGWKPTPIEQANERYGGDMNHYIDEAFNTSLFSSREKVDRFLNNYTKDQAHQIEQDPLFKLCVSFFLVNRDVLIRQRNDLRRQYGNYHYQYVQAIHEMKSGQNLAPDANRSLRVSYGQIKGYSNEEQTFSYQTDLESVLQKNEINSEIYPLPNAFLQAAKSVKKRHQQPVCFISSAHTTGGNSGSPVLDKKGRLIGLVFDRASYGLISDFQYLPEVSRNIAVDIRYVLFVLEHQLNAQTLIAEWRKNS